MQLNELKPNHARRKTLRVGRGGKRGTTSGRGQKGQKARSGHSLPRAEREMIMKFPKARGITNKPKSPRPTIIQVSELGALAVSSVINKAILAQKGLIANPRAKVKILGGGKLVAAVTVQGLPVSASAKKAIEASGGKVE
jgi:large subunit ribosomal protein L15